MVSSTDQNDRFSDQTATWSLELEDRAIAGVVVALQHIFGQGGVGAGSDEIDFHINDGTGGRRIHSREERTFHWKSPRKRSTPRQPTPILYTL